MPSMAFPILLKTVFESKKVKKFKVKYFAKSSNEINFVSTLLIIRILWWNFSLSHAPTEVIICLTRTLIDFPKAKMKNFENKKIEFLINSSLVYQSLIVSLILHFFCFFQSQFESFLWKICRKKVNLICFIRNKGPFK